MRQSILLLSFSILFFTSCQKIETIDSNTPARPGGGGGSTVNLNQGLVAYYPFSGNANDASRNGNNGLIYGANLTKDRFNKINSAYSFNGINSYIQTSFVGILGSNKRALSFWAKTSSIAEMGAVSWGSEGTGNRFDGYFNYGAVGATANIAGAAINYNAQNPINDNFWHHYVFQVDGINPTLSNIRVYQDGSLLNTILFSYGSFLTPINTLEGTPVQIGRCIYDGIPSFFNGQIDDVRIYNRTLNQAEITYLATH